MPSDPDLGAAMKAEPQMVGGRPVRPTHWGLTRQQIGELLAKLREDPNWDAGNNVYTLVQDYIIPWTKGAGLGYALQVNGDDSKEVNLMISHAWGENTEEFFETLLRSCSDGDVLFVCALSLYQAEDGQGPTIAAQIGEDPMQSPFRQVLANIRSHQEESVKCTLSLHSPLRALTILSTFAAVASFYLPAVIWGCVPGFDSCAMPETSPSGAITWRWQAMGPRFGAFLFISILSAVCGIMGRFLLRSEASYNGRMLVVPNRECDLYTRLWCVYEIFVAMTLKVKVKYAPTLASAGRVRVKLAKCSSTNDAARIDSEISSARHTYEDIDRLVFLTTRASRWHAARVACMYGFWIALFITASVNVSGYPPSRPFLYFAGTLLSCVIAVSLVYYMCRRTQGVVRPSVVCAVSCAFLLAGLSLQVWGPTNQTLYLLSSGTASTFNQTGLTLLVALFGTRCFSKCPYALGIVLGAALVIALNELYAILSISLWYSMRSMPLYFGSAEQLLVPSALRSCTFYDNPYPCGVRGGTFIALFVVRVYIVLSAGRRWGVRIAWRHSRVARLDKDGSTSPLDVESQSSTCEDGPRASTSASLF